MQKTDNYELNLPEAEDFFSIEDFNDNTKKIDEVLESLENPEHDTGKQAEVEELASGESLKVALRKLAKAVSDYISHKADQVAHITAAERTAWNAKLGSEKIAANLTTTETGMLLDATMGKQLAETDASLQEQISTLNSNLPIYVKLYYLDDGAYVGNVRNLPAGLPFVTFFKDYEGSNHTFTGVTTQDGVVTITCEKKFCGGNYLLFCYKK